MKKSSNYKSSCYLVVDTFSKLFGFFIKKNENYLIKNLHNIILVGSIFLKLKAILIGFRDLLIIPITNTNTYDDWTCNR